MRPIRQIHCFVLIDALGASYVEAHQFLADLLPYRSRLQTVLGFSSGAIPAILTGRPPVENGHWNLFYYDPFSSPFRWLRYAAVMPRRVLDHRVTRRLVTEIGRRALGLGPLFECCVSPKLLPWFNWVERQSIYSPGGIVGARSIFDRLVEEGIPYRAYTYRDLTDAQILTRARQDMIAGEASFFFLYLSELDGFLHMHCEDRRAVADRLAWYGSELRALYSLAGDLDPRCSFTVFSDHGMTPVSHHYDLVRKIGRLGLRMPEDYLAVYDSTMARYWFFSDAARRAVTQCLASTSCGQILSDKELEKMGAKFDDRRYGELIFLLHPGWLLARSDFNGQGWRPRGMHGYHPNDPHSDATFLSNQRPPAEMRNIIDIHRCLEASADSLSLESLSATA